MIFVLDATGLVHVMYHVTEPKDPPDVVERFLIRLEHLNGWAEQTANGLNDKSKQIAVFDGIGKSFRSKKFPSYKAQRTKEPGIYECLEHAQESLVNSSDWQSMIAPDGFEADDLIASIAYQADEPVIIHSCDKDFNQCLVDGRVGIIKRSGVDSEPKQEEGGNIVIGTELTVASYTERDLRNEFGFSSSQWIDYQCLVGDSADNVPGARWIGHVTAMCMIQANVGMLFEDLGPDRLVYLNKRQKEEWPDFIQRLPLLRDLFTLRTDLAHSLNESTSHENQ